MSYYTSLAPPNTKSRTDLLSTPCPVNGCAMFIKTCHYS